jgi:hypothetical protein
MAQVKPNFAGDIIGIGANSQSLSAPREKIRVTPADVAIHTVAWKSHVACVPRL